MTRFLFVALLGWTSSTVATAADPKKMEWTVGDVKREALVYIPEKADKEAAPVVFAFHGHGGTMKYAATKFAYHKQWPEAICVYMQGLNTVSKTDPKGEKPGWQNIAGSNEDRDLKFFDDVIKATRHGRSLSVCNAVLPCGNAMRFHRKGTQNGYDHEI